MPRPVMAPSNFTPSTQMVSDLTKVSELPLDQLRAVAEKLKKETGVISISRMFAVVESVLGDRERSEAVTKMVVFVGEDSPERILAELRRIQDRLPPESPKLTGSTLEKLRDRLAVLSAPFPAVAARRKAEHLRRLIGSMCGSIDLICDLRPVFDEERKRVEGLIPIQILRIVHFDHDGNKGVFEVCLDEEMAEELIERLELGKQKFEVLRQNCDEWVPGGWAESDSGLPEGRADAK